MSEMAPEGGEIVSQGTEQVAESTGDAGGNPAWKEFLDVLPSSLHSQVTPVLQKWDQGVQERFQQVHSQYEPYKPLIEGGYDPQTLQYSLAVLQELENNPRAIYDALAEQNGWAVEQGQTESEDDSEEYDPENVVDPRLTRAEQLSEAVAEYVMNQHQQQQEQQEDAALDQHINALKEQHQLAEDPLVDRFVIGLMLGGMSAEDAFSAYVETQTQIATRPRAGDSAPVVMGSGGGVPSAQITSDQLKNPQSRKALVAQMLAQAAQNQG